MSFSFGNFFEGVGAASVLIVAAEIKFDYSLGDKVKDLFLEYVAGPIKKLFSKLFVSGKGTSY